MWTMMHGDALESMRTLESGTFDAIVTDPPYSMAGGSTNGRSEGHGPDSQFFTFWLTAVASEMKRLVKPEGCAFIFCDWRTLGVVSECMGIKESSMTAKAWAVTQALVWDRGSIGLGSPFRNQFEMIAFARDAGFDRSRIPKNIPTVLHHAWPYGRRHQHHGAEKPVGLVRRLVEWAAPAGGTVLDPFAGSGTTGVACAQAGRSYVGIEISDTHIVTASERCRQAYSAGPTDPPIRNQGVLI